MSIQTTTHTQTKMFSISLERSKSRDHHIKNLRKNVKFDSPLVYNKKHSSFLAKVYVGSPPQEISAIMDSGSSLFFITSNYCHENKQCKTRHYFNYKKSNSFSDINKKFELDFAAGNLAANFGTDTIMVDNNITIQKQVVGLIYKIKADNTFDNVDALIGISYPMKGIPEANLFDNLVRQGLLQKNVIGYYLNGETGKGKMTFGYIDDNLYEGELNKVPVTGDDRWSVKIDDVIINGQHMKVCEKFCRAIIDTGATDISIPSHIYEKISRKFVVPKDCKGYEKLSDFSIVIHGVSYKIKKEDYVEQKKKDGKVKCYMKINKYDLDKDDEVWIVGETFLQRFYTIFDRENDAIHFAKRK
jgi:hypothetical protein